MAVDIFAGILCEDAPHTPEGGVEFTNSGFIGKLVAARLYKFWSSENIGDYAEELPYKEGVDYYRRELNENSYHYYFKNQEVANLVATRFGLKFGASLVLRMEMPTSTVLNFQSADAADRWGKTITADARVMGLVSQKYRHEYHLIVLPALVDAYARLMEFIPEQVFTCDELLNASDSELTKEFQFRYIGHAEASEKDAEAFNAILTNHGGDYEAAYADAIENNVKIHYTHSILWRRRAALWAALGESNPAVYMPIGSATTERGKIQETKSQGLSHCLKAGELGWSRPVWARLAIVKDPSMGSEYTSKTSGATRRPMLPYVSELFADEAAARAANGESGTDVVASTAPLLALPKMWGGLLAEWKDSLGGEKRKAGGTLPSIPGLLSMAKTLECSVDDIKAWWGLV